MEHGILLSTVNLNAPDPGVLGRFYAELLGWEVLTDEPDWVVVGHGEDWLRLSFERDDHFVAPTWPSEPGRAPIQMHLDVRVVDLPGAVAHAQRCGARLHVEQPQKDVRVLVDPAGHVFCLWLDESTPTGSPES